MTIDEIRQKQRDLEWEISQLLQKFSKETQCNVTNMKVETDYFMEQKMINVHCKVEV